MRALLFTAAAVASIVYAFAAPAFTPVVTAPMAFSWAAVGNIMHTFFCTGCGGSSSSNGSSSSVPDGYKTYRSVNRDTGRMETRCCVPDSYQVR